MNSTGLIFGVFAGVLLLFYLIGRAVEAGRSGMLKQYEVIRKRFGFDLRRFGSKWGWGIGEHYAIDGTYRGYSVRVYEHYHQSDAKRQRWTSVTFELLFTGGLEIVVETPATSQRARFPIAKETPEISQAFGTVGNLSIRLNDPNWVPLKWEETQEERLRRFFANEKIGAIRLSKGFLEYREEGILKDDEMRIRFQDAILVLADISDALSAHPNRDRWEGLFEDQQ